MSHRTFHPGSDGHALLVVASMFLVLAIAAFTEEVPILAAPAVVFAVLSVVHAFEWRARPDDPAPDDEPEATR
jgi:hypothetical protein